MNTNNCKK